jgi:transposase-like protein
MDFPISDLLDEDAGYHRLLSGIHPGGLNCPDCHHHDPVPIHRRHRQPVLDYRCGHCGRVFNAVTDTALQGLPYRPSTILLILRGLAQGVPTAPLARELNCDRGHVLALRHQLQELAYRFRDRRPLDDPVVEADELYQNAGEKGVPHLDPLDPPRRRGNPVPGPGSWDHDRPPVCGVVGRESGRLLLGVEHPAAGPAWQAGVRRATGPKATVNTDEGPGSSGLEALGRRHVTVCHAAGEWARDDDGDGIRAVHTNTSAGIWTGLRNFLRPFRGVNKIYLHQYAVIFQWGHNLKEVTGGFIRAWVGTAARRPGGAPLACPA